MAIYFSEKEQRFIIETNHTCYVFDVLKNRYLQHIYYGAKKSSIEVPSLNRESWAPYVAEYGAEHSPDTFGSEISFFGAGDFRPNALKIRGFDGTGACDFEYSSYEIFSGRKEIDGLPYSRANEKTETLKITLQDKHLDVSLFLYYTVFPDYDIITRYLSVENNGISPVKIEKCMSLELTFDHCDYDMISLYGSYGKELNYQRVPLHHGLQSVYSNRGASSHHYNPFFALCSHHANENSGDVYGFNFVYSGSFLDEVDVNGYGMAKVLIGLGSECFSYTLNDGEKFESPESIFTYSSKGISPMRDRFHRFVRDTILPKSANAPHPVVLNTWEGSLFDVDERLILQYAGEASKCGFDMLIMDDGWFAERKDDTSSLGDWYPNGRKFPHGLKYLTESVRKLGLKFGIWIEPEMISPDSDLYRQHPNWAIAIDGREPLLVRNQLVLDMSNDEVIEYIKGVFDRTFSDFSPDYFKWDMNRPLTNVCSQAMTPERQGEVWFRHMKGTYRLLDYFSTRFPNAIIETCASGGGRYDLGMMQKGFQIWASDMTQPYERIPIQCAALTCYPALTMSCHVSNPKEDLRSLDFRYKVSACGMLGYELNIVEAGNEVKCTIQKQISDYKMFEHVIREGLYRELASPVQYDYVAYYYLTEDANEILLTFAEQKNAKPGKTKLLKIKEAVDGIYVDNFSGKEYSGKELRHGLVFDKTGEPFTAELMYLKIK